MVIVKQVISYEHAQRSEQNSYMYDSCNLHLLVYFVHEGDSCITFMDKIDEQMQISTTICR